MLNGEKYMTNNIESICKILFLVSSFIWIGNILLLRSERQIIINPILILIASVLVFLPSDNMMIFGMETNNIKSVLYILYCLVVMGGVILTKRKTDLF